MTFIAGGETMMVGSTDTLVSVMEQCQQTLSLVCSEVAILSDIVSHVAEPHHHMPQATLDAKVTQARARLDALQSVVWRLRLCRSEARHAEAGRHLADEDLRAFQDYLALTLRDLSRMGAAEKVA